MASVRRRSYDTPGTGPQDETGQGVGSVFPARGLRRAVAAPVGFLVGDRVLVRDEREANALYNKGYFGQPRSGGSLDLDLVEAVYLEEAGRLRVVDGDAPVPATDLFVRAASAEPAFEIRFVVYRDLRARGLVTRASNVTDFNAYPPGAVPGRTPSSFLVRATSERAPFDAWAIADEAARSADLGKRLLVAVVDEEGDLTHYAADLGDPRGATPARARSLARAAPARLLHDRVIVTDADVATDLHAGEFLGRDVGPGLQLSFAEALYLAEDAALRIASAESGDLMTPDTFRARARAFAPDFDRRYRVYRDLKSRGLVVKTGFKFGTHFRAYEGAPDEAHAPLLVHALEPESPLTWPEVAGFVRLAHGVRKDVLFALGGRYLRLRRTKP